VTRTIAVVVALLFATAASAADDLLKWNKSPEAYYMTAEERAAWKKVATEEQARAFIEEYFRKRGEQFRKDVRTRIDLADQQFRLDKIPGSRTQRGRVWMVLGNPTRSTTNRETDVVATPPNRRFSGDRSAPSREATGAGTISPFSSVQRKGLMAINWIYERTNLDPELKMPELRITFQIDMSKGAEAIENPGFVEPAMTRMAELISKRYMQGAQSQTAQRSMMPSMQQAETGAMPSDPLWNVMPALNGAIFTGDAFISPTEHPYYAYSFYVPQSSAAFADWKSALLVTLVRDESGRQVAALRTPVDLAAYDASSGARFVDGSVALPPGRYEGLFALYTPDGTTLLSSHRTPFEVAPKDAPRASGLFFTSRIETLEQQDAFAPFTFVATKYAVRGDRVFRAGDKLAFFTVISNPTGSPNPQLAQRMLLRRDGKDFARTPFEAVQLTQTGPNTFLVGNAFEPDTFPAGHYTIELQVRDLNAPPNSPGYVLRNEFDVVK
jgi:GWxTD domain-containing protein